MFGFDQDEDAQKNIPDDERFTFIAQNFRFMKNYLKLYQALVITSYSIHYTKLYENIRLKTEGPLGWEPAETGVVVESLELRP